mgnify:CR=1 FL=1
MKKTEIIIKYIREYFDENKVPLHRPLFKGNEKKYLNEVIESTYVSTSGQFINQSQNHLKKTTKANHVSTLVNGSSALQIALQIAGVNSGDEVLTQAISFIATSNAIINNGAYPVFLDSDIKYMSLSPESLQTFLNENTIIKNRTCYNKFTKRKISACIPVHVFGFPAKIDEIIFICDKFYIPVIEDAAESLGSFYKQQHTGTFGKAGIISFNGNKIITSGSGGAILTNDKDFYTKTEHIISQSKLPHSYKYIHDNVGFNLKLPNLNAALLLAQLEKLEYFINEKRRTAKIFHSFFKEIGVEFVLEENNTRANYWLYCLRFDNERESESFVKETNRLNLNTRPVWKILSDHKMNQNYLKDDLKNAKIIEKTIVNIPSSVKK